MTPRELVKARYDALTIGVWDTDGGETNSELLEQWNEAIRQLAARTVLGVHGDAEYSSLCHVEEEFRQHLERTILDWAEGIETARRARESAAA